MNGFTEIDNVWVEDEIFSTYFSCDYEKCEGGCCWVDMPDVVCDGGILLEDELTEIEKQKGELLNFVSDDLKELAKTPTYIRKGVGYSSLHPDGRCVYMDGKGCALKEACACGKLSFDIPLYCQLYPLWTSCEKDGTTKLFIADTFTEMCKPAYEKGKRDKVTLIQFCRIPIIRLFGEPFYSKLFAEMLRVKK